MSDETRNVKTSSLNRHHEMTILPGSLEVVKKGGEKRSVKVAPVGIEPTTSRL
jgi:hypothetical protein